MKLETTSSNTLRYRRNRNKASSPRSSSKKRNDHVSEDGDLSTDLAGTDGSETERTDNEATTTTTKTTTTNEVGGSKFEKMIRRTKLAFFMLFLFCVIVSLGHIYVVGVVWILQALAFRELTNLRYIDAKEQKLPWFRTFHWCLFISATLFTKGRSVLEFCVNTPYVFEYKHKERYQMYRMALDGWSLITFNIYAGLFVIFVLSLKKGYYKYQFSQLTWSVFSLGITMIQANGLSENILEGYIWFILPAMLIACNDTMVLFLFFSLFLFFFFFFYFFPFSFTSSFFSPIK